MSNRFDHILKRAGHTARFCLRNASGATAIEYGLIAGLLSIVIFSATAAVGSRLASVFELLASRFP